MKREEFIRMLRDENLIPLYMTDHRGRKVIDRVGTDETFANLCDDFGYGRKNWTLTHKEGGQ